MGTFMTRLGMATHPMNTGLATSKRSRSGAKNGLCFASLFETQSWGDAAGGKGMSNERKRNR